MYSEVRKLNRLSIALTVLATVLLLPSLVAAQEKVAFATNRDVGSVNHEIYVMNIDGTDQRRMTFNDKFDGEPSFDRNGGRILFTSTRDGNGEIYVMNADGSKQTRLTHSLGSDAHPSFSPDGSKITFISDREGGLEIFTMNSDGTNIVRLTDPPYSKTHPTYSPDGNKIMFTAFDGNDVEIWLMNTDGSNPVNITDNDRDDRISAFNPLGTKIVYMSDNDPVNHDFEIFIMNVDGSNQTPLTSNTIEDQNPSFSSDGNTVVFVSGNDIWAMTPGGTGEINISNHPSTDFAPSCGAANVAPVLSNVTMSTPINEGETATLSGDISDGNAGDSFTLSVDWGDGNGASLELPAGTTSFNLTHTYLDDPDFTAPSDDYQVTMTINDHRFGTDVEGGPLRVNNLNPIVTDLAGSPSPVELGNPVTLTANYTDPGYHGSPTDEQLFVRIIWGDGQIQQVNTTGAPGAINETHQYAAVGNYTITVQVSDNDSGLTLMTLGVVVSPPPPPVAPTGLRVEYIAANRIQLIWDDNSNNEDGYAIERCSNRGCNNFIEIGRTFPNIRAFLDGQLFPNTQYYYRVRAFNAGGMSEYTEVVGAKTLRK